MIIRKQSKPKILKQEDKMPTKNLLKEFLGRTSNKTVYDSNEKESNNNNLRKYK